MELFTTIIAGFSIFVGGQIFVRLVVEPVQDMKKTIAKIRLETILTSHILHNSQTFQNDPINGVFDSYRMLASELLAALETIPFYSITRFIFGLPSIKKTKSASSNLIALSNWVKIKNDRKTGHILKNSQELNQNLRFKIEESEKIDKTIIDKIIKNELGLD
jgi:hypothetical protein